MSLAANSAKILKVYDIAFWEIKTDKMLFNIFMHYYNFIGKAEKFVQNQVWEISFAVN